MAARQGTGASKTLTLGPIALRHCQGLEEMRACVALQKQVWKFSDAELVPLRLFVVAQKIGGQVIGAFSGERMVGFALSLPGNRSGHSYLHSQMLGVLPEFRDGGLGRRIKLFQRDDALACGFELIEWTFDPLEIKNAYLNLERLGAIARRYNVNQYGVTSSPLQGGLPTDRLVAEWWLKSRRVESVVHGSKPPVKVLTRISVPAQIYTWKASPETRGLATEVQTHNREDFLTAFSEGLAALGYERGPEGSGSFLLGKWDEPWFYPGGGGGRVEAQTSLPTLDAFHGMS